MRGRNEDIGSNEIDLRIRGLVRMSVTESHVSRI